MNDHLIPRAEDSLFRGVMKDLTERGLEAFGPVFQLLLNEAMKAERSEHLHAVPYERTEERRGYEPANDHGRKRSLYLGAGRCCQRHRDKAQTAHKRRHQHRP